MQLTLTRHDVIEMDRHIIWNDQYVHIDGDSSAYHEVNRRLYHVPNSSFTCTPIHSDGDPHRPAVWAARSTLHELGTLGSDRGGVDWRDEHIALLTRELRCLRESPFAHRDWRKHSFLMLKTIMKKSNWSWDIRSTWKGCHVILTADQVDYRIIALFKINQVFIINQNKKTVYSWFHC